MTSFLQVSKICFRDLEHYPSVVHLRDANHQHTTFPMWHVTKEVILKPCQCQLSIYICFVLPNIFSKYIWRLTIVCIQNMPTFFHHMICALISFQFIGSQNSSSTPSLSTQLQPQTTPTTTITTNMSSISYSVILTVNLSLPQQTPAYRHQSVSPLENLSCNLHLPICNLWTSHLLHPSTPSVFCSRGQSGQQWRLEGMGKQSGRWRLKK